MTTKQYVESVRQQNRAYFAEKERRWANLLNSVETSQRREVGDGWAALEKELYEAVKANDTGTVERILDSKFGGIDINFPFRKSNTPLIEAANAGHLEMSKLLLERGASVDVPGGGRQRTALMQAA